MRTERNPRENVLQAFEVENSIWKGKTTQSTKSTVNAQQGLHHRKLSCISYVINFRNKCIQQFFAYSKSIQYFGLQKISVVLKNEIWHTKA